MCQVIGPCCMGHLVHDKSLKCYAVIKSDHVLSSLTGAFTMNLLCTACALPLANCSKERRRERPPKEVCEQEGQGEPTVPNTLPHSSCAHLTPLHFSSWDRCYYCCYLLWPDQHPRPSSSCSPSTIIAGQD